MGLLILIYTKDILREQASYIPSDSSTVNDSGSTVNDSGSTVNDSGSTVNDSGSTGNSAPTKQEIVFKELLNKMVQTMETMLIVENTELEL